MMVPEPTELPTFLSVLQAAKRIEGVVHRTPVMTCGALDQLAGASLFLKCENLQKVGAFKFRGATNAVRSLPDKLARRGVATHSSGNHAAALALAAKQRGIPAHIVMPESTPEIKRAAVRGYGAEITFCESTLAARESTLAQVVERTGATFVHPYDNADVIAGQGTAAHELVQQVASLDIIIAPVGGGGLLAGTALAAHGNQANLRVWAAEPEAADDAFRSLAAGVVVPSNNPITMADGLLTSLGDRNFAIIKAHVERVVTVTEDQIAQALRLLMERAKLVVEPSAAVALAAVLSVPELAAGKRIGVILSGGNISLDDAPWRR